MILAITFDNYDSCIYSSAVRVEYGIVQNCFYGRFFAARLAQHLAYGCAAELLEGHKGAHRISWEAQVRHLAAT